MSPRKLTAADKDEILRLYRSPQETTSTLAERFEVSSSTISRFLKNRLPEDEYEDLIQQKRLSRTPSGAAQVLRQVQDHDEPEVGDEPEAPPESELEDCAEDMSEAEPDDRPARRRRTLAAVEPKELPEPLPAPEPQRSRPIPAPRPAAAAPALAEPEEEPELEMSGLEAFLDEEIEVLSSDDEDDDDDDDFADFDDEEDEDDDDGKETHLRTANARVTVLPIGAASLPRTCYLVIDRASELIACPLQDFGDLGSIPPAEVQQKTLPVFDNHRVARRFSQRRRSQRVIKIPDSRLLEKTQTHLQAKGITRLLFDGQVYDLTLAP